MRSFCSGCQQSTNPADQEHNSSSSQGPQLHSAAGNSPSPSYFLQLISLCSQLCAFHNHQPIAPTFPRISRFMCWCHPYSSAMVYLQSRYFFSQLFNFLIRKKKIMPPPKKPNQPTGLKKLKHRLWIFPAKLFLKPDATNWQFFKQFV